MKTLLLAVTVCTLARPGSGAEPPVVRPYEIDRAPVVTSRLDRRVLVPLRKRRIEPANLCSDEVFVRRVFLDVIGTLPTAGEVREFLESKRRDKRAALIDELLKREEFADYWSLKWCDLLRVKSEFPINLWPNAVQAYHRWIRDSIAENKPYDQFTRELLTSSGSNFRVPPVNFYRAVQGHEPSVIAQAAALTLMGVRVENWPQDRRSGLQAFFSRVAYKTTAEWKEEIVYLDPAPTGPLDAAFPDGTQVQIPPTEDPRQVFAGWLIASENPWFTRNIVNRVWAWLMGRGIIHEPDDIRPDNPPANPELLAYLEKELVRADYDLRHLYRLILNSRTYQQSSIPRSDHPEAQALFAYYAVRRLDAEVMIDALCQICGPRESYMSAIPEPFTFIPEEQRTITLADGSITSPFLEMFGRPTRDTGREFERDNKPTDAQRLHLLNSSHIQKKIENGANLRRLLQASGGDRRVLIHSIFLTILSRYPTITEFTVAESHFDTDGLTWRQAAVDLVWALINSKEFLCRH
ncbi:MAG: DUF1553 domain-containing protein [Planctomycetota bacterium]|jgi:hypothetical protein